MSDDVETATTTLAEPAENAQQAPGTDEVVAALDRRDGFLIDIINLAMNDIELNVTMTVGGGIVSGKVISGKKYFEAIKAQIFGGEHTSESRESNGVDKFFAPWLDAYDRDDLDIGYIHLEGARHFGFGGNPIPNNTGVYWRGKVDAVDGFAFGILAVGD